MQPLNLVLYETAQQTPGQVIALECGERWRQVRMSLKTL